MSIPLWFRKLPNGSGRSRGSRTIPASLRWAVAQALPLTVVLIPQIGINAAETWLLRQGAPYFIRVADRPLRACLIARRGHGIIFLDGADTEDEQRFSLAHQLSHFLHDYFLPRCRAVDALEKG